MDESVPSHARVPADDGSWAKLIRQVADGDEASLAGLSAVAGNYVKGIAMRILRNEAEADEVASEVFQQVWRLAVCYEPARCPATAWLAMLTRSRALDRWRSLQARRRQPAFDPRTDEGIESLSLRKERDRSLWGLVEKLPAPQREAVTLTFREDLSHSEVAERLQLPIGTVKTRIRLALIKLRREWAGPE